MLPKTRPALLLTSKAVIERAREVFTKETEAIAQTAEALDDELFSAVKLIAETEGKIVLVGVGKSALVAQKIAGTMSSLGTPAVFMHASDSLHGDLGLVQKKDTVIILSLTGTTPEIVALLPSLKQNGIKTIAITGDPASPLGRAAEAVLTIRLESEACGLNLAPTSSTSAMLVLGDALAIIISEIKGFKIENFAQNHPGGSLGRKLLWQVKDVMHPHSTEHKPLLPDTDIEEIISALTKARLGAVNIVSSETENRLIGIITDGDIRRATQRRDEFFKLKATDIMTRSPVTIQANVLVSRAMELMEIRPTQISVLPVVDSDGKALGLVRIHDLL